MVFAQSGAGLIDEFPGRPTKGKKLHFCKALPMKKSRLGRFALGLSFLLLLVLLPGCSKSEPTTAQTPAASGTFTGQDLPDAVEQLEGTPLYTSATELAPLHKLEGACFLLIAPQSPDKTLMVFEEGAKAESLSTRESKPIKVSGTKETLESPDLVKHVKERYGLDLQMNEAGQVVYLKARMEGAASE